MVQVRSVAFVQLYFCFKQAVFNLVFSYMFIDLGTEDPKSQQVRWWKSWQSQTKRFNSLHGKHEQVSLNNHAILWSSICVKAPNTFRAVSNGVSFMMEC
jgi:hypothetical protein